MGPRRLPPPGPPRPPGPLDRRVTPAYLPPKAQLAALDEQLAREAEWAARGDETEVNPFAGAPWGSEAGTQGDVTRPGEPAVPVPILLAWLVSRMPEDEARAIVASLLAFARGA